jgi:hypothetical protein
MRVAIQYNMYTEQYIKVTSSRIVYSTVLYCNVLNIVCTVQ